MTCALCQRDLQLCRSHLIPEFFYKQVYDPAPKRFYVVSSDADIRTRPRQSGEWEWLLCKDCEARLNRWETYVAWLFGQKAPLLEPHGSRLVARGVDYSSFKLFQLSVLWRAAVSSRPFFADVELPPEDCERLRQMILTDDPGEPEEYGCWLLICYPFRKVLQKMMLSPDIFERDGHVIGRFLFGGLMWNYHITPPPQVISDESVFITKGGVLPILVDDDVTSKYLIHWMQKIKESGNFPDYVPDEDT